MRIISLTVVIAALAVVPIAAGDGIYHSQHIPFIPVATGESGSGFVENIHANGPNVFAHEQYALKGGLPLTAYEVVIHVSTDADPTCSAPLLVTTTATITTNPAGNGSAYHVFRPADVGPLHNSTIHVYWTLQTGGTDAYTTACVTAQLD